MKSDFPYTYRFMRDHEINAVFDLVLSVFHQHIASSYSAEGLETFLSTLTIEFLKDQQPKQFTIVAETEGRIDGMLTNIDTGHIALLFVDSPVQRHGIGKGLIHSYLDVCRRRFPKLKTVTVSASPNSVSFYLKVGFTRISAEQNDNGLRFTPMQMAIPPSNELF